MNFYAFFILLFGIFFSFSTEARLGPQHVKMGLHSIVTFNPDYTYKVEDEIHAQPLTWQGVEGTKTFSFVFDPEVETFEILEAQIRKRDKLSSVPKDQILERTVPSEVPGFVPHKEKFIILPYLREGDEAILKTRRTRIKPPKIVPLLSYMDGQQWGTQETKVEIRAPQDLPLFAYTQLSEVEEKREGGTQIYRWFVPASQMPLTEPNQPANGDILPFFSITSVKNWEDFGKTYWKVIGSLLNPTPTIKKLASEITQDPDLWKRAVAIARWVQENVRYLSVHLEGDGGFIPTPPEKTLELGYGDCKDVVSLFIALAKASGIEAELALINSANGYYLDGAPLLQRFDHVIAYLPTFKAFVDLTHPAFPIGELLISLKDKKAFVLHEGGRGELIDTPSTKSSMRVQERQRIHADGILEGEGTITLTDHAAAEGRILLKADTTPYDFYKVVSGVPGPGQIEVISGAEVDASELVLKVKGLFPHFTSDFQKQKETKISVGSMVDLFKGSGLGDLLHHPDRVFPIVFPYKSVSVNLVLSLPAGYGFTDLPEPVDIQNTAGHLTASFTVDSQDTNTGTWQLEVVIGGPLFEKERIDDFLSLAAAYLRSLRMSVGIRKAD